MTLYVDKGYHAMGLVVGAKLPIEGREP